MTRKLVQVKGSDHPSLGADPNNHPDKLVVAETAAANSCQFLGETFAHGETISYQGAEWLCSNGVWLKQ